MTNTFLKYSSSNFAELLQSLQHLTVIRLEGLGSENRFLGGIWSFVNFLYFLQYTQIPRFLFILTIYE